MRSKFRFIPNYLSALRLLLVVVFLLLFNISYPKNVTAAMAVFIIAGVTDVADGALARRYGWESNTGRLLDPLADKLMQCAALISLTVHGVLPLWFTLPYITKELVMLGGGAFMLRKRETVVSSRWYGKAVCVTFYALMAYVMICGDRISQNLTLVYVMCGLMLTLTLGAMVSYFIKYFISPQDVSIPHSPERNNNEND